MKKLLLLFAFCMTGFNVSSQILKGKVVDNHQKPLEFVNIVLLGLPDSTFIAGTISDSEGCFSFDTEGDLLRFSSIGYTNVVRESNALTSPVVMTEETNKLDEVVIKGRLPKYKQTDDGLRTNVSGTTLSQAGTANDVLRNLPLVKEEEDGFSVFGKGVPQIYINGRILRDKTELERIKSSDIKNVEIITDPGAKYDASVGCVIKIKTITPQGEGLGFALHADYLQAEREDINSQMDINYRKQKWDLFGTLKFSRDHYWKKSTVSQSVYVDTLWNQSNTMRTDGKNQDFLASAGFNYQFNDSNQIGTRLQTHWYLDTNEKTGVESLVLANNHYYDRWQNKENKRISHTPLYDYNLYYNGKVGEWSLDYNFDLLINGNDTYSNVNEQSEINEDRIVQSENNVKNRLFASRFVIGHPFLKGQVYGGMEHSFVNRTDNYINFQNIVPSSYSQLKENYLSSFIEYSQQVRIGLLKAGLRYEFVDFKYFDQGIHQPDQSRRYSQFFPNVSFATRVGKTDIRLEYTTKVKRPSFSQLSNNVFYGNRYTLQTGNPLLRPSVINNIGLAGLWKMIQFGLFYSVEHDAIIYSAEQLPENQAVTTVMFKNLDKLRVATSFISVAPEIGIWSPQITTSIRKQWLTVVSNHEQVKMNKPLWNASFNNTLRLPWDILLSLNFSFQSKGDYQNVYLNTCQYILNASISKTFLDKRLSIQLKGYDLLDGYRDGNLLYNKQMRMDILNRDDRRKIGLSIKYKFNVGKSKYQKTDFNTDKKKRL